jgi:hypothetical protein
MIRPLLLALLPTLAQAQVLPPGSCYERAYSDEELAGTFSPVRLLQVFIGDSARGMVPPEGGALVVLSALVRGSDELLVGGFACLEVEGVGPACDLGDGVGFELQAQEDGSVEYYGPDMNLMGVPLVAPTRDSGTHVLVPTDPAACL